MGFLQYIISDSSFSGVLLQTPYEKYLPKPEVYEIQGVVSDDRMVDDDSLSDLAKSKNIEINITQLRLSRHEPWNECRGKILVLKPVIPLKYGMSVLLKLNFQR